MISWEDDIKMDMKKTKSVLDSSSLDEEPVEGSREHS